MKGRGLRLAGLVAGMLILVPAPASALNLGGVLGKALEKKDAIIKTTKALRKGFAALTSEEEYYIGRSVAAKILSDYRAVDDPRRTRYINTLGQALRRYSTRPETYAGYHFLLIDSKNVNAFAAPGGFIFITTGLYSKAKNEEQLAAVLAHEISHVTLKHGLKAIKSSRLTEAFTIIGTEAAKEYTSADVAKLTAAFEGTINDIVNKMVVSGYSRKQEYAADKEALHIVYRAGYNPRGLAEFLETLNNASKGAGDNGFYKTHPPAENRLNKVEKALKKKRLGGTTDPARTRRFLKYAMK